MKRSTILAAIGGILVGALAVSLFHKAPGRAAVPVNPADWSKLNVILQEVDKNYVDSIDHAKVTDAAVEAALAKLDPHSIYLKPETLKESEEDLAGNFDGIGIQFNVPNDTAIVLEVIPGGPSEKIGLQPGDRILKVDDKVIAGVKFPQDSMVRRMKGPAGTKVLITVGRDGAVIPFEITRGKIPTHSIDAYFMVDDTTGYVRLSKFSRTTYKEFSAATMDLLHKGMERIIVDLRDNSGGFFDQSLMLSDLFLSKGACIVYMEGLHREREEYKADGKGYLKDTRLVVLIDDGSASSSEIFAGAMQDNDRGILVGRRSFGKGLVQEPLYFSDGSAVRLTVARFYTPSGRCIQKPYDSGYNYEVYERYATGEMTDADSMKVDKSVEYHTVGGRVVYGGGGIIPDVFVPMDTTKASRFYVNCNKKATAMRFASWYFDNHKKELSAIDDYQRLLGYLDRAGLESAFLEFAKSRDGLVPDPKLWAGEKVYMMTQVKGLVGRYSKLGDKAYYHIFLQTDETFKKAMSL